MRTIGIRALKAQLSQVLHDVQRGDVILVTDRGRVVAELRSPDRLSLSASPIDRARARMAADGGLRLAERPASYQVSPLRSETGTAQALIDEERGDA